MSYNFQLNTVNQLINSILTGRVYLLSGCDVSYETYTLSTISRSTLYHVLCKDNVNGKAIWHAWYVHDGIWLTEHFDKTTFNKTFKEADLVSYKDMLFYDPLATIDLPERRPARDVFSYRTSVPAEAMMSSYRPFEPSPFLNGPGDYPFQPSPGMPVFNHYPPQHYPNTRATNTTADRSAFGKAEGLLHAILAGKYDDVWRVISADLFAALVNKDNWVWDANSNEDPSMIFTYTDGQYPKGIQSVIRRLLMDSLKEKGYAAYVRVVNDNERAIHISVNLKIA